MKHAFCVVCGGAVEIVANSQPGRSECCAHCQAYLHACRQCRFYDPSCRNECREPRAEYVVDKTAGNFCTEFEFQGGTGTVDADHTAAELAKRRLAELFKM